MAPKICAVIPARGGSKGVPNKNIRQVAGKPLIVWTIQQALDAHSVDRVVVSTDSPEIAKIAIAAGAEVPGLRPPDLAGDAVQTEPVLIHAVEQWCRDDRPDLVLLLQPTSPIRKKGAIDRSVDALWAQGADSLLSVCADHAFFWKDPEKPSALYDFENRPRRQEIPPEDIRYRETGSIYLTKIETLLGDGNRLGGKIALFEMDEIESWEIDTEVDLLVIEALLSEIENDY